NGGPYSLLERLKSKEFRDTMRESTPMKWPVEEIRIDAVKTEKNKWCEGLMLSEIADKLDKTHWDIVCDLLVEENLEVSFTAYSRANRPVFQSKPATIPEQIGHPCQAGRVTE
ncbi:MAG: hypothetical protein H8D49_05480, partial [Dehalococcoidia bacterium]|nr:hypothetical protein [Dehalococcoidia bacterium]